MWIIQVLDSNGENGSPKTLTTGRAHRPVNGAAPRDLLALSKPDFPTATTSFSPRPPLLAGGTDPREKDADSMTVAWAAVDNHPDVAKVLVARGAGVNAVDCFGYAPLRYAPTVDFGNGETAAPSSSTAAGNRGCLPRPDAPLREFSTQGSRRIANPPDPEGTPNNLPHNGRA